MRNLDEDALALVATYFGALAVPMRLRILGELRDGERNVGELTSTLGCTQANVSKHLGLLAQSGLVAKAHRGSSVYYRFADDSVYQLCELVCNHLDRRLTEEAAHRRGLHDVALLAAGRLPPA